jgi:hypothetical protein
MTKPNIIIFNPDQWRGDVMGHLGNDEDVYCNTDWMMVLGAIDFINKYEGDKPLCIYLPISFSHPPYGVEDPWYSQTEWNQLPDRIMTPESWTNKPSNLKGIHDSQGLQKCEEDRRHELRATYYGMCARVAHQFGLLTIIVLVSC